MLFTPAEIERLCHLDPDDPELLSAIERLYEAHDFVGQVALRKSLLAAARDALLKAAEEIREVLEGNHIKPAEDGTWIPSGIFSNLKRWGILPLTVLAALREAPYEIARLRDDRERQRQRKTCEGKEGMMGAERIDLFLGKAYNGCMCLDHILPNESAKVGRDLVTVLREGWTDENGHHTVPVCWPSDCPKCGEGWLVMHRTHVLRQVTRSGDVPAPPSVLALPELLAIKKPSKAELQALGY